MRIASLFILTLVLAAAAPQDQKWDIRKIEFEVNYVDPMGETLKRKISFELVRIPFGKFLMGSPESEADRDSDEGPQKEVEVNPFWMARTEVNWNQYYTYVYNDLPDLDATLIPSWPYEHKPDLGMGDTEQAAMSIQWHKAYGFTVWLSKVTGKKFRLPTEAEWEYACRAGSTKPAPEPLGEYAWYKDNSDTSVKDTPWNQKVGQKKPNAFGLYDMLGGVWEYCQDIYKPDLKTPQEKGTHECLYDQVCPHVMKGGSYRDPASELRAANRDFPRNEWNIRDPQRPRGTSWLTEAPFIGFRVVMDEK